MNINSPILNFGKYKGLRISELTDEEYLCWLGKPTYTSKFYVSLHSTEKHFKVPFGITLAARKELEKRGYYLIGEKWRKEDE